MGEPRRRRRPATTPEGREQQLISLAADVAEEQMLSGTASAQVITHFLKLGSSRERAEQERIKNDNLLLSEKIEGMRSGRRVEALYEEAMAAFRSYKGQEEELPDGFEGEYYDDDR